MPLKPLKIARQFMNLACPFSYRYTGPSDFAHLLRKINLYFTLNPQKRKHFSEEIDFLNTQAHLKKSVTLVWPYPFVKTYEPEHIQVYKDEDKGMYYVIQNGRKLYYSRKYDTIEAVQKSYNSLVVEQNPISPHQYLREGFQVEDGDFVLDIGAAEGNFSLDIVEKAGKLVIVEAEAHWIEALNATFEPWKDKVEIIHKYVSDTDNERCATLKSIAGDRSIDFLKLDVEGAEMSILSSSAEFLQKRQIKKLAVCTYHKKNDEHLFSSMLRDYNYDISLTPGYMLFVYGNLTPPYFRKVMIQAVARP